jgi:hypothetical protein
VVKVDFGEKKDGRRQNHLDMAVRVAIQAFLLDLAADLQGCLTSRIGQHRVVVGHHI